MWIRLFCQQTDAAAVASAAEQIDKKLPSTKSHNCFVICEVLRFFSKRLQAINDLVVVEKNLIQVVRSSNLNLNFIAQPNVFLNMVGVLFIRTNTHCLSISLQIFIAHLS